ncbi:FtsK/SpoIIIE family protein [Treponema vincentii ATCC 35580]|uniref:FtsK/SpoIIIE family protein n=1 Tax=Treponema vincentii ATCC 35580 TaxID=596324 RepID=C8PMS1_9SPIR|nr:FtsK/SpoIIIE family protein [Treponema vincentii ATCC 35580]
MGNRENRFRILAVVLSVLFFCAGIVLTLGIFLPITGLVPASYKLFAVGQRIFSVYGFSSFLIPLLFLYGAVLLLIPGWSRESKAVLLGVPLYFVTAIIGERLIYIFVPSVSIPLIRQFVTVSILICALLLICFEIFLMLTLSEKLSGKRFFVRTPSVKDNAAETDTASEHDTEEGGDADEEPALQTPPVEAAMPTTAAATEEEETPTEASLSTPEAAAAKAVEAPDSPETEQAAAESADASVPQQGTATTELTHPVEMADTAAAAQSKMIQTEQTPPIQPDAPEMNAAGEASAALLENIEAEDLPLPLSTPLSAVMDIREEEAERPVFDPADPNNLFASLEEITAPVERIKRTDSSEPEPEIPTPDAQISAAPTLPEGAADSIPEMPESAAPAASQTDSIPQAVSNTETEKPEMPLVFVNGVPLPNGRSEILDTMVVIDSEKPEAAAEETSAHSASDPSVRDNADTGIAIETQETDSTIDMADAQIGEDIAVSGFDVQDEEDIEDSEAETDIGAEAAVVSDENTIEADLAIEGFDARSEEKAGSGEAAMEADEELEPGADGGETEADTDSSESEADRELDSNADEVFLETIDQTVPVIPAKPVPPPQPRKKYAIPFDLLTNYPDGEYWVVDDATRRSALMLKSTFNEFKIDVSITGIRKGPVVTMFEMLPSPGIKLSKITNLQDNIALRLAASSVRIVAPIPGKHAVGIEVPNKKRSIVSFRELIETDLPEAAKMAIPVALGKDVTGNPQVLDLAQTPHLLIAGATGSGKSVCVNSIILSILYNRRPDEVKLILVDPKIVELKLYNDIAHLLTPVITEPKRAFQALQYALCEMERRYALLDNMGVRDIKTFNAKIKSERIATEALPYIVIIIDEFADLMATSGKELEATVARLCAMSRAVGIHLVLATQRPSIDVITGLIKANIPSRIAFMVASKTDSRIILDEMGAEKLLGKGDMLYVSAARPFPTRIQGAFVSEQEVERVVACVKEYCEPEYIDEEIFVDDDDEPYDNAVFSDDNDPLYEQALEIVTFAGKASASYVQRKLKIGYNRAARLIEEMEARGIVGPANGSKAREVIRHV